jgi:hypothetical protein
VVARGPGDVGCAHCTKLGATQTCQVCTHLVCDVCAADWTTCSEPAGREIRLGTTARVRDVDPNGRFAIVSHWVKGPRLFDLRHLKWAGDLPISRAAFAYMRDYPPRLTSTGMVAYAEVRLNGDETTFWGVRWRTLAGGVDEVVDIEGMQRCSMMSTSDQLAYVSQSEKVIVMTPKLGEMPHATTALLPRAFTGPTFGVSTRTYDPMPRKVIHAMHLTNDILVTASWRELVNDRIVDDKLERLARIDTGIDANIEWVTLAGSVLAYFIRGIVEVRRVDAAYNVLDVFARHRGDFTCGALSVDGRYLALGIGDRVLLHDLERDEQTTYEEHSDNVSFVKFAADGHMLITADDDNRVVLRPRTATDYARAVIPA